MQTIAETLARATACHRAGQLREAEQLYEQVLAADPAHAEAHCHLGVVWAQAGKLDQAIASFERAQRLQPHSVEFADKLRRAWAAKENQLGNELTAQGQLERAAACYTRALQHVPDYAQAHYNLANLAVCRNQPHEAIAGFRRALELKPDFAEAHSNLAVVLWGENQADQAIAGFRRALALKPDYAEAATNLGALLADQGRVGEAKECYERALAGSSKPDVWRLNIASLCPSVFGSAEEIVRYRRGLLAELDSFAKQPLDVEPRALVTSECKPSFNLHYHGCDERPLRAAYAKVFGRFFPAMVANGSAGRPRVGFVVTDRHEGLFLKSMGGVVARLNRELFEVFIVGSERSLATIRPAIFNPAVQMLATPARFDAMASTIHAARFDLLYYWEVGTDNTNYFLPYLRLAPVQCTSWGIQITSGIPGLDYYVSSALVEPDDAADHYTERLVLAGTLLSYQHRVSLPESPKRREDFGIGPQQHLYLCAQNLRKFHPDFDAILRGILRRDNRAAIVLTEERYRPVIARQLRARFTATIPDVAQRIMILPSQPTSDYLSLTAAADVLLDPLHYGGVNSSYDGFSLDKPIVTFPSRYQRGRYTLGCYKKMGVTDCVATTADEYVDIAVRLATDETWRGAVEEQIRQASGALFEDPAAISEHERIFAELVANGRRTAAP